MLNPFLTVDDQIARLQDFHDLEIEDDTTAKLYLARRNYYRLNYYFKKFLGGDDKFGGRISFNDIVKIEETDSKLRHMLFQYIGYIELKLRTQFGYWTAEAFQADAFYNQSCFATIKNISGYTICQRCISEILSTHCDDPAIKHHVVNYNNYLPTWVAVEFLSFGSLSLLLKYLKSSIRDKIINYFRTTNNLQIAKKDSLSWVHAVSVFRNICAHHGALFRLKLRVKPAKKNSKLKRIGNANIFSIVYCINYLLSNDERTELFNELQNFEQEILNYTANRYQLQLSDYGFPQNWCDYLT